VLRRQRTEEKKEKKKKREESSDGRGMTTQRPFDLSVSEGRGGREREEGEGKRIAVDHGRDLSNSLFLPY